MKGARPPSSLGTGSRPSRQAGKRRDGIGGSPGIRPRWRTSAGTRAWADRVSPYTTIAAAGGLAWTVLLLRNAIGRRREDVFLLLWFLGAALQAVVFSYFVAARFLLPALLPAVLLAIRGAGERSLRPALALALALSLLVGAADFEFAGAYREAARVLHARYARLGGHLLFREHWGFQYYLEKGGHRALDRHALVFDPGDRMAFLDLVREGHRCACRVWGDCSLSR
jgi:hypothetical protein